MITSKSNPLIRQLRRLRARKHRERDGLFLVEGLRPVLSALENDAPVVQLLSCPELLTSEAARAAVADYAAAGGVVTTLSRELFHAISSRDHPVGLAALVEVRAPALDDLPYRRDGIYVGLVDVADPGNLGTILRTMDAVGAAGLVVIGQATDPYHPTAVKASMGALFTIPVVRLAQPLPALSWADRRGLTIVAASVRGQQAHWGAPLQPPALLLMGSERQGLDDRILAAADVTVAIPMQGQTSSLNLGVATAILLYEMRRPLG